jgi:hypothetical protein
MKTTWLVLGLAAAAGCARVQISEAQYEAPQQMIRTAEEAGADAVPEAKLHLDLARDEAQAAKELAASGEERARLVLARAQVDAEKALALTREAKARGEAARAANELRSIRGGK